MNRILHFLAIGAFLVVGLAWSRADDDTSGPPAITALPPLGSIQLFNGRDLKGWTLFFQPPAPANPTSVWNARDGVLSFKSGVKGYLRTEKSFTNYNLHVEYRWPQKIGNSGIFVHEKEPDAIWPYSLQINVKLDATGDLIPMGGFDLGGSLETIKKTGASNEQPLGAWNSCDIFCRADSIDVYVNGELRNHAGKLSASSGQIALQLEGTAIEFRNVWLQGF